MTPEQIAGRISRKCLCDALDELRTRCEYRENHDATVAMLNRLMRPAGERDD